MDQITTWCCLQGMQDAYVAITLVDGKGNVMGRPQDTPTSNNLAGNHVLFNCEVSSAASTCTTAWQQSIVARSVLLCRDFNGAVAAPTLLH